MFPREEHTNVMSINITSHQDDPDAPDADALARRLANLLPGVRNELEGLREEVQALREEVRSLRGRHDPEAMMSVDEAAELAGLSRRTMDTLIHEGRVPSAKIGRRRLVPSAAFRAWLKRQVEEGA